MSENSTEMVQTFMVVQCYSDSCKTFQVHQVKKTNKWVCKICTQKQSVLKVYLKGTGKECRKCVQKLNTARGFAERDKSRDVGGNHPPCDYADTFTTQDGSNMETQAEVDHPVVFMDSKKSRWTAFIGPDKYEDEEDETTTDRGEFSQASKAKRKARRSLSERKPHPLSAYEQEEACPYSSINLHLQMESDHDLMSSKSMYFHPNRYTKLDTPSTSLSKVEQADSHSHSMFDLSSAPSVSPDNHMHKEWMSEIKRDLEQFSQDHNSRTSSKKSIPKVSSRWSQFMCEEDESESEEEVGGKETTGSHDRTTHILACKSTIAKFTLVSDM